MPIPVTDNKLHKPKTEKMQVYYTLRDWITYGTLEPGEWINQQEISEHFGTSRIPVREALQLLENQKLVVVYPNRGTFVSELNLDDLRKWYDPLANLQGLAAKLASQKITPEQLAELERLDRLITESLEANKIKETLSYDEAFHKLILDIAGNEFITEFCDTLLLHVRRAEMHLMKHQKQDKLSFYPHKFLVEALRKGDGQKAFDEMIFNCLGSLENKDYKEFMAQYYI